MLVSRWHYKHRCFDLPHTRYLISLGAAPRCFHGLNLSSSCLFSCLARKINILYMYITLWLEWFSVCFNWLLIPWTAHIWVFLNLLFVWPCGVLAFVCVGCDVWLLQLEETVKAVVCPDQVSECPDDTTCCQLPDSSWGCCPLAKVTHISTNAISLPKITDSTQAPGFSHQKMISCFLHEFLTGCLWKFVAV